MKNNGYFPIRILETKTQKEYTVEHPKDIPSGVKFKVLETNTAK